MRQKSSYRLKQERGLVPTRYDVNSKNFMAGAWRHWPENRRSIEARRLEAIDRQTLELGRERRKA
jgi:hypothetical protein